jgi:tetratricopeptide (TPR) repeat protein
MLNIHELERKWLKYKIKSYIPHIVIAISSLLIIVLLYILINSNVLTTQDSNLEDVQKQETIMITNPEASKNQETAKAIPLAPVKTVEIPTETPILPQVTPTEQKLLITPSMNFIKNIQHDDVSYNKQESYKNKVSTPSVQIEIPHQAPPASDYIEETVLGQPIKIEEKIVQEEEYKANSINIKRQNEYSDIQEIITRFKKNNNPTLSLFIAKKYYELGEYRNAYNYSLITNELNKDIEASWIIFAQSLVKLNEKDKAIKILQEYIKHSNSNRANLLLDEILSGKFK